MWGSRGFTLLEVLISITLLGFIAIGVISVTDNAVSTKERTSELNKNNLAIESALARLEWDIGQIYSPLYFSTILNMQSQVQNPGNIGSGEETGEGQQTGQSQINPLLQQYYEQIIERMQQSEHFMALSQEGLPVPRFYAPEKNIFEFLTASNRRKIENVRQSSFAWVRYGLTEMSQDQIKDNEGIEGLPPGLKNLTRWFDPNDPWGMKRIDIETVKGAVLLQNVEVLEFSFWDYQKKKWETNLRTIQQGESVIRGVKVFIAWYDSQGVKRSMERVFRNHWPMVVPQDQATTGQQTGNQQRGTQQNGSQQGSDETEDRQ